MPLHKTIIVWLRNDLRLHDNEALYRAVQDAEYVLPVYCLDPRQFGTTSFGFAKTGGVRARFLLESLRDLRFSLQDIGGDLFIGHDKPESIIYALAKFHHADAVYCQQEATDEEIQVEDLLIDGLASLGIKVKFFWGHTLFHYDDLPFEIDHLPSSFAAFQRQVEQHCSPRPTYPLPQKICLPKDTSPSSLPTFAELQTQIHPHEQQTITPFKGGETTGRLLMKHYLQQTNEQQTTNNNRNNNDNNDNSNSNKQKSKLAPWFANGSLSPRLFYEELKKYEQIMVENAPNNPNSEIVSQLIRRDYWRFVAMAHGNDLFKKTGIEQKINNGKHQQQVFEQWKNGQTGLPWIDAQMRELLATGFLSEIGRQSTARFLMKQGLDWRAGAEWFESCLIDYDPCSNYGNWNEVAKNNTQTDIENANAFDPIEQALIHDPKGEYVRFWCPELRRLPSTRIHRPYTLTSAEQQYVGLILGKDYPKYEQ